MSLAEIKHVNVLISWIILLFEGTYRFVNRAHIENEYIFWQPRNEHVVDLKSSSKFFGDCSLKMFWNFLLKIFLRRNKKELLQQLDSLAFKIFGSSPVLLDSFNLEPYMSRIELIRTRVRIGGYRLIRVKLTLNRWDFEARKCLIEMGYL